MKPPIKKLLVIIGQSNSCNLIYFYYKFFGRGKEANTYRGAHVCSLELRFFCIFLVLFSTKIMFSLKKTTLYIELLQLRKNYMILVQMTSEKIAYKSPQLSSMINVVGQSISSMNMWNIVNQLGNHDFSCNWAGNNLK